MKDKKTKPVRKRKPLKVVRASAADISKAQLAIIQKALKEGTQVPIWKPKKGESLIGCVTEIRHIETKKGRKKIKSRIVSVQTQKVKLAFWDRHIIADFLDEQSVKVGDIIGIKFLGKIKNYFNYNCFKLSN